MADLGPILDTCAAALGSLTIQASLLILLILALQALLRDRLAPRWRHLLWLTLAIRLALPWTPESPLSLYNLLPEKFAIPFQAPAAPELPLGSVVNANPAANQFLSGLPEPPAATAYPLGGDNHQLSFTTNDPQPATLESNIQKPKSQIESAIPNPLAPAKRLREAGQSAIIFAWLAGAAVFLLYVITLNFSLWLALRRLRPLTNQAILDLLETCKEQMGVATIVALVETGRLRGPALFGFLRPRLILPPGLVTRLTPDELRHVFLHELAHLKRRDIYVGWLTACLQAVHWFNPLVWFAFARLRAERELACDALVLDRLTVRRGHPSWLGRLAQVLLPCRGHLSRRSQAKPDPARDSSFDLEFHPSSYGQTIIRLLETASPPQRLPALAGILENPSHLKRRIAMIASFQPENRRSGLLSAALCLLLAAATLTNAQSAPASPPAPETVARQFVDHLVSGNLAAAVEQFDSTMKTALPQDKLRQLWQGTLTPGGPFQKILGARQERMLGDTIVFVTTQFEKGPLDIKVVINPEGKISGLWLVPTPQTILGAYQKNPPVMPVPASPAPRAEPNQPAVTRLPGVLRTNPRAGANNVPARLDKITVTFDQPMMDQSWSWTGGGETYPQTTGKIHYDPNRTTCTMPVKLEPAKVYWVGINSPSYKHFQTVDHTPAQRYVILFATADAAGKPTPIPQDMLAQAHAINARNRAAIPSSSAASKIIGKWRSIDFVDTPDKFQPGRKSWSGDLFLREVTFNPDGSTIMLRQGDQAPFKSTMTWKGEMIYGDEGGHQMSAPYIIKNLNGETCLFLPWLNGDVAYRGQKPKCYVLKKSN